jgi:hypothetical protein
MNELGLIATEAPADPPEPASAELLRDTRGDDSIYDSPGD